jgi:ferrous iron transport protein B
MHTRTVTAALIGNPNAGKTTLFNALSGLRQRVGNYPGVTVEKKTGRTTHAGKAIDLIDLPGTYSLAARSPDEMVAVDVLLGRQEGEPPPDVVVAVADASNLERHLYLTTQLLELGRPVVIALTMVDVAEQHGAAVDAELLATRLGVPVIPVHAARGHGLERLKQAVVDATHRPPPENRPTFPAAVRDEVGRLKAEMGAETPEFLARRVLFDVGGFAEKRATVRDPSLAGRLDAARTRLREAGCPVPASEARARYGWLREVTAGCVNRPAAPAVTWTDRLDRVLTHKLWGTLIFLALMFAVFVAIFAGATPLMDLIKGGFTALGDGVRAVLPAGPFTSLLADGVIGGVGSVLVFLPQILILFGVIAVLEDCGYMARAAFLMDRLMSRCGLSGKSFIPMLSSMACAVPGIMGTRVIENPRDRLATILVAPLMSCSARLPVYTLLIKAFFPGPALFQGLILFAMYLVGLVTAPLVALALKRTLLRGETPLFVMELPLYRWPSPRAVLIRMFDSGWAFVRRAGTLILASMVLVWALLYFPSVATDGRSFEQAAAAKEEEGKELSEKAKAASEDGDKAAAEMLKAQAEAAHEESKQLLAEWKGQSWLGRAGRALEPAFRPLGWDWRVGMAALASFPAREVIVGTLRIIYGQDEPEEGGDDPLGSAFREAWKELPGGSRADGPRALGLMVFFALCCQCASTLAVIRRETNSWFWPAFTFTYMTALAYVGALVVFQVGAALVGG